MAPTNGPFGEAVQVSLSLLIFLREERNENLLRGDKVKSIFWYLPP